MLTTLLLIGMAFGFDDCFRTKSGELIYPNRENSVCIDHYNDLLSSYLKAFPTSSEIACDYWLDKISYYRICETDSVTGLMSSSCFVNAVRYNDYNCNYEENSPQCLALIREINHCCEQPAYTQYCGETQMRINNGNYLTGEYSCMPFSPCFKNNPYGICTPDTYPFTVYPCLSFWCPMYIYDPNDISY